MLRPGYRIGTADPATLERLPAIERAAAERFSEDDLPEVLRETVTPVADFERAAREGRLWTAVLAATAQPVGFALVAIADGCVHLEEMDVLPEHGRHGIGRALVAAVIGWGRQQGYPAVTLTTFRHVPWNAPFYRRLGFRALPETELTPALARHLAEEAEDGLERRNRVAMRLDLGTR